MTKPSCVLPDCDKPSRNPKSPALCPMHYHRQYRHGRTDAEANSSGVSVSHGRRYRRSYRPGHPVADKNGGGWEHRFVLYDAIGAGPHPCHWCKSPVDWVAKGEPGCLQVDHLNHIGDDNRPENLVPSCGPCNSARGMARRHRALVAAGWWSQHDTIARLRSGGRRVA